MFLQHKKQCDEANETIFQICCKNPDFRQGGLKLLSVTTMPPA